MKKSLLVIHKIRGRSVNTLTVDENYYLLIRDNLTETIQIQLSQKQNFFFQFFLAFLKSPLNFEYFPKKVNIIADVFPETLAPKNMIR